VPHTQNHIHSVHSVVFALAERLSSRVSHATLPTCTGNGVRTKHQPLLHLSLFFPPATTPAGTAASSTLFLIFCASERPRRLHWRRTAKDMLQQARASRDDWESPGCHEAWQRAVLLLAGSATSANARGRCGPCILRTPSAGPVVRGGPVLPLDCDCCC
jgi:hypothetical protein